MSCCQGNCGCGSSCKCGNGCTGCKMYPDLSCVSAGAATETLGVVASKNMYFDETVAGENGSPDEGFITVAYACL
ncbi:hypothetical protein M569_13233 [Genlisea aurea]|uniref:Metallothionein-like protein n=1 Tax=Genlisea aurea TaxID=192259 RepID=S8DP97_9LAMI|nr:hypothetical protein M569_13233 [Genlisea aurea]